VKVTVQEPLARVHEAALSVPADPLFVNDTVPVGVLAVPRDVSVTVAVQVEAWLTTTGEVQLTAVVVARLLTVMFDGALVLAAWIESVLA